jgi:hypothetical protein
MSTSSIGSAAAASFGVAATGQAPDLTTQKAQVNAQADLLQAARGINLPGIAVALLSDGEGIDLYM